MNGYVRELRRGRAETRARRDRALAREALVDALAAVYSGAGLLEADALIDQLEDRGYRVEPARSPL